MGEQVTNLGSPNTTKNGQGCRGRKWLDMVFCARGPDKGGTQAKWEPLKPGADLALTRLLHSPCGQLAVTSPHWPLMHVAEAEGKTSLPHTRLQMLPSRVPAHDAFQVMPGTSGGSEAQTAWQNHMSM